MNYIFEIIELNKFTNDLRTLYKNYFNKWVEYGGDPLTALHASTISTNEKVISDISKTFKEDIIENFAWKFGWFRNTRSFNSTLNNFNYLWCNCSRINC